jgi:hypothetical protein
MIIKLSTTWLAIASLACLFCGVAGCTPTNWDDEELLKDLDGDLTGDPPLTTFNGEWLCDQYVYAVSISGRVGTVTLPNATGYKVGDAMLTILTWEGNRFNGRQRFTDGSIQDIIGRLIERDTLLMAGGGFIWSLTRISPVNEAPLVNAGNPQTISMAQGYVDLDGTVVDDGLPNDSLVTTWSQTSGPADVSFADTSMVDTRATFTEPGTYVLQLKADDGELSATSSVTITVE